MKTLILALALFAGNAFACSCGNWGTAAEMISGTDVAFVGKFVKASTGELNPDTDLPFVVTQFSVTKAFKPKPMAAKMNTRSEKGNGGNCGTNFQAGQSYLIFGYVNGGKVYTDACSYQPITNSRAQNIFLNQLSAASRGL